SAKVGQVRSSRAAEKENSRISSREGLSHRRQPDRSIGGAMKRILSSLVDGKGFDIGLVAFPLGFLFVMSGLPVIYNVVMSFQEVDMFSLGTLVRPFVGFKNYSDLFAQPETLPILANTAIFVVASIAGQFLIGFGLALFFWVNFPGASWLRGLFL